MKINQSFIPEIRNYNSKAFLLYCMAAMSVMTGTGLEMFHNIKSNDKQRENKLKKSKMTSIFTQESCMYSESAYTPAQIYPGYSDQLCSNQSCENFLEKES